MNTLTFNHDIPYFKKGFHLDQVCFSGGRIGASIARHGGVGKVSYFGRQAMPNHGFFESKFIQSSWEKLFRLCVMIDGRPYYPEFNQTRIYPFGYTSECTIEKVRFQHEFLLLNDTLAQRIKVISNPSNKRLSLKLLFHGFTRITPNCRKWSPWVEESGAIYTSATDIRSDEEGRQEIESRKKNVTQAVTFEIPDILRAETHIGIGAHAALTIDEVSHSDSNNKGEGWKYYLNSGEFKKQAALFICFNPEKNAIRKRVKTLNKNVFTECDALLHSFSTSLKKSPQIYTDSPAVQSCLTNIPRVLDSLKIQDIPGALRASASHYWTWSWDSLVHSSVYLYSNDAPFLKDMLLFVNQYADKNRLGIPHLVTTHLEPLLAMAFPAQCIYIIALYNYYFYTHDEETLKKCYPLAVWLLERCMSEEVGDSGLIKGISYFPDFPEYLDQNGNDISSINNSIFYQGVMTLRCLAQEMCRLSPAASHSQLSDKLESIGQRCKNNFIKYLYDAEKGYFVDSVDSRNFSKRLHYPVHAILWISHFAGDLLGTHTKQIASFMIKNFTQRHGLSMYPTWDSCFLKDGNQLGAYYPVTETFFRNVLKLAGRSKEQSTWFENVAWFWNTNTLPEGFTYDAVNEGFTPDNPGGKQAFCGKSWYDIFFRTMVGIEVDDRGLVITPSPLTNAIAVENFRIGNKRIDIKSVSSQHTKITLNGQLIHASGIIPLSHLKVTNQLKIYGSSPLL